MAKPTKKQITFIQPTDYVTSTTVNNTLADIDENFDFIINFINTSTKLSDYGITDSYTRSQMDSRYARLGFDNTFQGHAVFENGITVRGDSSIIYSNELNIGDNIITLNAEATGTPTMNAGWAVNRGSAATVEMRWNESITDYEVTVDGSSYHKLWHAGNDGAGSGLNADMVDGKHASEFATSGHNHDTIYGQLGVENVWNAGQKITPVNHASNQNSAALTIGARNNASWDKSLRLKSDSSSTSWISFDDDATGLQTLALRMVSGNAHWTINYSGTDLPPSNYNLDVNGSANATTLFEGGTPLSAKYAASSHTHDASEITSGTLNDARISNLPASKITTGTFNIARIPTGTTSNTVALGNHNHDSTYLKLSGGSLTGDLAITGAVRPRMSGFIGDEARSLFPSGISYQPGGGTGTPDSLGVLLSINESDARNFQLFHKKNTTQLFIRTWHDSNAAWMDWKRFLTEDDSSSFASASHNHSAANITSGTLDIARIPTGTTSSTVALGNHTHSIYGVKDGGNTWIGKQIFSESLAVAPGDSPTTSAPIFMRAVGTDGEIRPYIELQGVRANDTANEGGGAFIRFRTSTGGNYGGEIGAVRRGGGASEILLRTCDSGGNFINAVTVESNGNTRIHGNIYEGGTLLSSKYASASHNHSAANITSGTLNIARIPTGTTSNTVALGDHTHTGYASLTDGNTWTQPQLLVVTDTVLNIKPSGVTIGSDMPLRIDPPSMLTGGPANWSSGITHILRFRTSGSSGENNVGGFAFTRYDANSEFAIDMRNGGVALGDNNFMGTGTLNATSLYEGGTAISSKYLSNAGGTLTGSINFNGLGRITTGSGRLYIQGPPTEVTDGEIRFSRFNTSTGALQTFRVYAGNSYFSGEVTAFASDERLKSDFTKIDGALDKISRLKIGYFNWKKDICESLDFKTNFDKRHVGFGAQSMQSVLPEAVRPAPFNENYLTIQYERVTPLLAQGILELREENENLKVRIKILEDKLGMN